MVDDNISDRVMDARRRSIKLAKILDDRRLDTFNPKIAEEILLGMSKGVTWIELQILGTIPIDCNPHEWVAVIPEFAVEYHKAEKLLADAIVHEALYNTKISGDVREYNKLVTWLAPKLHPQKFSERYVHVEDSNIENYSEEELLEAQRQLEESFKAEFEAKHKEEFAKLDKSKKKKVASNDKL